MKTSKMKGLTLIEIMISIVVVAIALLALMTSMLRAIGLDQLSRENVIAVNATRQILDDIRATQNFDEIYALYNSDPTDDPQGTGTAPGFAFAVPELNATTYDPDGMVGRIEFPGTTFGTSIGLFEDVVDSELGMPRDLNGDGVIDSAPHDGDYLILPIRIILEWESTNGDTRAEFVTFISPN